MNMPFSVPRTLVFAATLAVLPSPALGQDNHYWTDQFGNTAQLLGGAVIGSDSSLSAVYYNPGRIGFSLRTDLIVTGNIFELETVSIIEQTPPNRELGQTRFRLLPSLIAGEIKGGWLGDNRIAYSFLTRVDSSLRSSTEFASAELPGFDNIGLVSDQAGVDLRITEYWTGLTWARQVGSYGVGVSTFVAVRSQRLALENVLQAIAVTGNTGIEVDARSFDYYNWRLLWKLGVATEFLGWQVGVTLTTPPLRLFGSGEASFTDSRVIAGDPESSFIRTAFQEDLPSVYKSPLSIGAGGSRIFKDWTVHGSAEWFAAIDEYTVLDAAPVQVPGTGTEVDTDVTHTTKSVLNFALGGERRFEGLTVYGSLHSDFSAAGLDTPTAMAITDWNLWHLGGGISFPVGSSDMTLGLVYAFGSTEPSPWLDPDRLIETTYSRLTFLLGFDLSSGLSAITGGS